MSKINYENVIREDFLKIEEISDVLCLFPGYLPRAITPNMDAPKWIEHLKEIGLWDEILPIFHKKRIEYKRIPRGLKFEYEIREVIDWVNENPEYSEILIVDKNYTRKSEVDLICNELEDSEYKEYVENIFDKIEGESKIIEISIVIRNLSSAERQQFLSNLKLESSETYQNYINWCKEMEKFCADFRYDIKYYY